MVQGEQHRGQHTSDVLGHSSTMVPTTHQLVSNLEKGERVLKERKKDTSNVCSDRLVDDLAQVMEDTVNFVQKTDLGDSTRKIIDQSKLATNTTELPNLNRQGIPNKRDITGDVSDAASQLRRVGQLMVTSPAFRSFLWDFYQLSRDLFGPQIDQVVEKKLRVQDSEYDAAQKYGQVHQSAQFLPASTAAPLHISEYPHMQYRQLPSEPTKTLSEQSDVIPIRFHDAQSYNHQFGLSQQSKNFDEFGQSPPYHRSGSSLTATTQSSGIERQWQPTTDAITTGTMVSNEKRKQLVDRWREMFDNIKQDSHIQEAIRDMKQTFFFVKEKYWPIVQEQKEKVKDAAITNTERAEDGDELNVVLDELKGLLERFAGGKSLDPLIIVVNEWYTAIHKDKEFGEWFKELDEYLDTAVSTPATLDNFIFRGQNILQGLHRDLSQRFLDEMHNFLYAFINDEVASRLRASIQNVITDLFLDTEGRFVIKPDVYAQFAKALMPILSHQLSKIQICRVEEHNNEIEFTLNNIVLDANDLRPEQFDVKNITGVSVGTEAREGAELHVEFRISARGTTCSVQNAHFYYRKHTFPKIKDSGILDAAIAGNGLSYDIDVAFFADAIGMKNIGRRNHHDRHHSIFKIKDCRVDVDKLKMKFRDANHDILYKVFKPIIVAKATKEIARAIENHLRYFIKELDKASIQARDQALRTLDKTGASDRILRGTKPDQLNIGHSDSLESVNSNRQQGEFEGSNCESDSLGNGDPMGPGKSKGGVIRF